MAKPTYPPKKVSKAADKWSTKLEKSVELLTVAIDRLGPDADPEVLARITKAARRCRAVAAGIRSELIDTDPKALSLWVRLALHTAVTSAVSLAAIAGHGAIEETGAMAVRSALLHLHDTAQQLLAERAHPEDARVPEQLEELQATIESLQADSRSLEIQAEHTGKRGNDVYVWLDTEDSPPSKEEVDAVRAALHEWAQDLTEWRGRLDRDAKELGLERSRIVDAHAGLSQRLAELQLSPGARDPQVAEQIELYYENLRRILGPRIGGK